MADPLDWLRQIIGGGQAATDYDTRLSPVEEQAFTAWKQQYAPRDSGADYDLRGAFRAGLQPDPVSGHWPDTFKKPNHPTFSVESQYATGPAAAQAGRWEGERFIPSDQPPPYEPPPRLPGFGGPSYAAQDALTKPILISDDRLIEILRKFGILPPVAAGGALGALLGGEPPP